MPSPPRPAPPRPRPAARPAGPARQQTSRRPLSPHAVRSIVGGRRSYLKPCGASCMPAVTWKSSSTWELMAPPSQQLPARASLLLCRLLTPTSSSDTKVSLPVIPRSDNQTLDGPSPVAAAPRTHTATCVVSSRVPKASCNLPTDKDAFCPSVFTLKGPSSSYSLWIKANAKQPAPPPPPASPHLRAPPVRSTSPGAHTCGPPPHHTTLALMNRDAHSATKLRASSLTAPPVSTPTTTSTSLSNHTSHILRDVRDPVLPPPQPSFGQPRRPQGSSCSSNRLGSPGAHRAGAHLLLMLLFALWSIAPGRLAVLATHGVGNANYDPPSNIIDSDENVTLSEEKLLLRHLLRRYDVIGRGGRPVTNMSESITVEFGLGLIQMELDEKSKIFTTSMWTRLKWRDNYLTWNPNKFGDVRSVRMEARQVWIPDIMLYNTADPEGAARNALVVVAHDGTMQWVPHQIFKSSCSIDVTNFPFDRQQCHMWFGSWTHSSNEIDLVLAFPTGIDLSTFKSDYKDSCEWEIVDPEAERRLLPDDDPSPIAVLTFTLHLERKLVFSSYILTLPCVFLASLTLVVFWLPPDRPDRTSLAMSLFASFLVLLLILVEAAPPTASSVPTLGVYYCLNMVVIMMSIFLSSMVVNIHRGGENKRNVPTWLRVVALEVLGRIFCVRGAEAICGPRRYARSRIVDDEGTRIPLQHPMTLTNRKSPDTWRRIQEPHFHHQQQQLLNQQQTQQQQQQQQQQQGQIPNCQLSGETPLIGSLTSRDGHSGLRQLERSCEHLEAQLEDVRTMLERVVVSAGRKDLLERQYRQVVQEWKLVAKALDRFFFFLYLGIIIISLLTMFPRPPFIKT